MVKFPILKCPICGKPYKEVGTFGNHMRNEHPGTIPEEWSDLRYAYLVYTGKSHGHCRECGGDTPWNEATGAYSKICTKEACKKQYRDRFMKNMRAKRGKDNLFDEPGFRERQLSGRRISGSYKFQDGGEVGYMGSLEKAFLHMLDQFFRFPSCDILSPSPNRYVYHYENVNDPEHNGDHVYIPDFYIPSCNLEIELKSSDNRRPKNLMVDVVKDAYKDIRMLKDPMVNYVKIYDEDYHVFFQIFADFAANGGQPPKPIKYISRALLDSVYRDYIPDELLADIDRHIYKYSSKSVLRKRPALEGDLPEIVDTEEEPMTQEEAEADSELDLARTLYEEEIEEEEQFEGDLSDVGVNPMIYYQLGAFRPKDAAEESNNELTFFNMDDDVGFTAMEGLFDPIAEGDGIDARSAIRYGRWRDKLFGTRLFGSATAKAFTKVEFRDGNIIIRGINCNLLLYRIKEAYSEAKLKYIFEYKYNARSWKAYQKKKIGRGDMKIDYVYAPEFFTIELVELFRDLADRYRDASYRIIAEQIYENSWLSKADSVEVPPISLSPLSNLRLELLPHQKEFISRWPQLKQALNLNGYILAFKPGKGKTLTSVGLAECLSTKKIYIVCPNNLKDNWALELKKYYEKYDDDKTWLSEVCILNGKNAADADKARWVITNNENIKLMMEVAKSDPASMLILDESHNFRNYNGGRSKELFALADKIGSKNVLCVSATPIKAAPAELTPALRIIDPTFNDEAANMYNHCFDLSNTVAMTLVSKRFGMVIYRPAIDDVELPPKFDEPLPLKITNDSRYALDTVHGEVIADFQKIHTEWQKQMQKPIEDFRRSIYRYALTSRKACDGYLSWVINSSNSLRAGDDDAFHELTVREYRAFIDTYVRPNAKCPATEADRLAEMEHQFVIAAKSHMGTSVGKIVHPRRAEMFIALYMENRDFFYEKIRSRGKKTVIFSTMVPVIKAIAADLNAYGIKAVSISGETQDRLNILNQFRNDPNTMVLVASSWCLGVGVTLTEASQLFFFGAPWRSTDYEQASDRIYRIGQTDAVNIYNIKLKSRQKNLSDRMQEILEWSSRMFGSAMPSNFDDTPAMEGVSVLTLTPAPITISRMNSELNQFSYGMLRNGKIVNPDDQTEYDRYYRTLSPGRFLKAKGGICFDFAAYQEFYLKTYHITSSNYFVHVPDINVTHMFTVIEDGDRLIYPESAYKRIQGVYISNSFNEIVSFIVNNLRQDAGSKSTTDDFYVLRVRPYYGSFNETMVDYLKRIQKNGVEIPIHYHPNVRTLQELIIDEGEAAEESFNGNYTDDASKHYEVLNEDEMNQLRVIQAAIHPHIGELRAFATAPTTIHSAENTEQMPIVSRDIMDCFGIFIDIYQKLEPSFNLYPIILKIVDVVPEGGTALIPVLAIPFKNSALVPIYNLDISVDGVYMADTIQQVVQAVGTSASLLYNGARNHNPSIYAYTLTDEDVKRLPNVDMTVTKLLQLLEERKPLMIKSDDRYSTLDNTLSRIEVLDYGWIAGR